MRVVRLGFIATILTTSLSCTMPVASHDNKQRTIILDGEMRCLLEAAVKRKGYRAPKLPDVSALKNDYEVIDVLIDHIDVLHRELRQLSVDGC